nr:C6 finger domain-containing protein Acr-2 [Colletotrichum truncatum]KAF6788340.1 C6 finger domain-containing protein Acr-2 [Colletotrichum truncatum]
MNACWTCRCRRHKCDGTRPHCNKCQANKVECLGYGKTKPLTWVRGVANRGPRKNCEFPDTGPSPLAEKKYSRSGIIITRFTPPQDKPPSTDDLSLTSTYPQCHRENVSPQAGSLRLGLTDPTCQNLLRDVRFFIDHFERHVCPLLIFSENVFNPYQEIISRSKSSPVIENAIIALAACHFANSITGMPLFSDTESKHMINSSHSGVKQNYIRLKMVALRSLSEEVANAKRRTNLNIFYAAFLFVLLDLTESGANCWKVHVEGAKKMLDFEDREVSSSWSSVFEQIADEIFVFDTIGSTLFRPGGAVSQAQDHGSIASQRWAGYVADTPTSKPMHTHKELSGILTSLHRIRDFDPHVWATYMNGVGHVASSRFHDLLLHSSKIWKLTADIYATRVYRSLTKDISIAVPSVDELIQEFAFLGAHDRVEKDLIWPTFIIGAECTRENQRNWVIAMMEKIWQITFSANCKNAAHVLKGLWKKQDLFRSTQGTRDPDGWDWITEISLLDDHWILY